MGNPLNLMIRGLLLRFKQLSFRQITILHRNFLNYLDGDLIYTQISYFIPKNYYFITNDVLRKNYENNREFNEE